MNYQVLLGDCLLSLSAMPEQSVHCCVTSPPYYGLRDYGTEGQIGLEETPEQFIQKLVDVFREVRRVLRNDGTLWLNIGDSYNTSNSGSQNGIGKAYGRNTDKAGNSRPCREATGLKRQLCEGIKPKDMIGIPWMLAFALRADGWYLRQEIIWHKTNPMPESVRDRCTKAHEQIFLLSKSPRYYFDREAMKEPVSGTAKSRGKGVTPKSSLNAFGSKQNASFSAAVRGLVEQRNRRSVWTIPTRPYKGAHFATFPPALIEPCILAGCPIGGVVLDPFGGSGTSAGVAVAHGRSAIICELNSDYAKLVPDRVNGIVNHIRHRNAQEVAA